MTGSSITSEKNEKCDVKAKNAYKKYLESHGYFDVKRIQFSIHYSTKKWANLLF